ncbi:zyxin isoform X2 [Eupeodes corollae]|uniref:zyxin isoform X2 n=1 Tax=Eupeodes corollae TaxID=290404 RepID=UPI0024914894|nr:zyxin isoform X2 [Eupeodes corollae]
MDPLDEQLAKLRLINNYPLSPRVYSSASPKVFNDSSAANPPPIIGKVPLNEVSPKKVGPAVPPKPNKKINFQFPEVPQSMVVKQTCEPLYSKRLQSDATIKNSIKVDTKSAIGAGLPIPLPQRKPTHFSNHHIYSNNKVTLDNPDILDQQLEALEHHKKQLQKKGLLQKNKIQAKSSSASFLNESPIGSSSGDLCLLKNNNAVPSSSKSYMYSNLKPTTGAVGCLSEVRRKNNDGLKVYSNISHTKQINAFGAAPEDNLPAGNNFIYSNVNFENNVDDLPPPPPPPPLEMSAGLNITDQLQYNNQCNVAEEDIPPPPSPVSSSYSELRRATDIYPKLPSYPMLAYETNVNAKANSGISTLSNQAAQHPELSSNDQQQQQTYMNMSYHNNDYSSYESPSSQGSSTYESIYEPINPRPPSQLSSRSNYLPYTSYVNSPQVSEVERAGSVDMADRERNVSMNNVPHLDGSGDSSNGGKLQNHKEAEVEALTDLLVHSMDPGNDVDSFGICVACNERVIGENSGCTAMDQVYHITCFTCSQCQINLQGKPFYALDGKPYCEVDYLNTLEKCSVCMKPILERILRATGKPYHPQCFTCVVCGNSLDGIPFTVDATNQNYCIADFHKKFAPRCCVCKLPIMPEHGQEETVRVVALDRSFHFECYKCEDCGLLLSSEAEGRGCYPLDDHVLCKSCNAKRVQMLTNRMTTEL